MNAFQAVIVRAQQRQQRGRCIRVPCFFLQHRHVQSRNVAEPENRKIGACAQFVPVQPFQNIGSAGAAANAQDQIDFRIKPCLLQIRNPLSHRDRSIPRRFSDARIRHGLYPDAGFFQQCDSPVHLLSRGPRTGGGNQCDGPDPFREDSRQTVFLRQPCQRQKTDTHDKLLNPFQLHLKKLLHQIFGHIRLLLLLLQLISFLSIS